jgi:hypothetical protein
MFLCRADIVFVHCDCRKYILALKNSVANSPNPIFRSFSEGFSNSRFSPKGEGRMVSIISSIYVE